MLFRATTGQIIGAAMEVHRQLGPGYLESVYEKALCHELRLRGLEVVQQSRLLVRYKEIVVGDFVADIIVSGRVLVELKANARGIAASHHAQVINYLRATDLKVGLLLNFGTHSLQHKRLVYTATAADAM